MVFASFNIEKGSLKAWILASRPRTLSISLSPVIVAVALAQSRQDDLNWPLVLFAWLSMLCIQIGTNLINDAIDFHKGLAVIAKLKSHRLNLLSPSQFFLGGWVSFLLACLFGIPLVLEGGWLFVCILLLSVACGYLYTGGPWPLSYLGISEGFVLIFFGWVATGAIYYLQTKKIDIDCWLAATQIGLLAIVPHAVNNLRDYREDALVHKKTLAVRFGPTFARWEITFFSFAPFVLQLLWINQGSLEMALLPMMTLPFVIQNLRSIWSVEPGPLYHQFLAKSAMYQLIFSLLLAWSSFLTR